MKLPRRPSHVIFDLDGVLLDTEPIYTQATQDVVSEYGKVFDWSVKGDMIGRGQLEGAEYLVRVLDLPIAPEEYIERRLPKLLELFPTVKEIAGAARFVRTLHDRRVPMGVATSGERSLTDLKISRHGWFALFERLVCGDDPGIARPKPAPDIFLATADQLGVSPADCVVIEDSLAGVEAALAAEMSVVALPDPNMDATRYSDAHLVVGSYADLSLSDLGLD